MPPSTPESKDPPAPLVMDLPGWRDPLDVLPVFSDQPGVALLHSAGPAEAGPEICSWSLLGAGLSWGLCLLGAGPAAVVLAAILLIHAVVFPWVRLRTNPVPISGRSPRSSLQRQFRSWLLLVVTGIPVASWWGLMMAEQYGWHFHHGWWTGLRAKRR